MRSKLIICAIVLTALLAGALVYSRQKQMSGGYIDQPLLVAKSIPEIERRFKNYGFTSDWKQELSARNATYVFFQKYPYAGGVATGVYCYEQIKPEVWILRGFFPITIWNFQSLSEKREIVYVAEGDSVNVICTGNILFSIKSLASAIQPTP